MLLAHGWSRVRNYLASHRIALVLMVITGLFTGLPFVITPIAFGSAYQGLPFLPLNDEYHYLANIQEVLDGHTKAASVFLYEYKNIPTPIHPVNEWFYAVPALLFGASAVVVAAKFVLPALLFLLTYLLLCNMLGARDRLGKLAAIAGALVVALGAEFVAYSHFVSLLKTGGSGVTLWTRAVNPISGAVQLVVFLVLLWGVWDRRWRYAHLAAGVALSITVGYFFTLGMSLAVLGALFTFALVRGEYGTAYRLVLVGVISVALDALWWHSMLTMVGGEAGKAVAMQNGMSFTHAPVLNKALVAASAVFAGLFIWTRYVVKDRANTHVWLFSAALIIGCWMVFNQQIITGREVWYHHFMQYTVPLSVVAVIVGSYLALRRYRHLLQAALLILCAITLAHGAHSLTAFASSADYDYFLYTQTYAGLLTWLRQNAPDDCVVLPDPLNKGRYSSEALIPTFTRCNTYTVWDPVLAKTEERNVHNYLLQLRMRGVTPGIVREYLLAHAEEVRGQFYGDLGQAFGHGMEPWVEERIERLADAYSDFYDVRLDRQIRKYRVDYLLSEGPLRPHLHNLLPDLTLATSSNGYFLYTFPADDSR